MKTKNHTFLISNVIILLLSACVAPPETPAAPAIQTAIAQTQSAQPHATAISTASPTTTATPAPTLTLAPAATLPPNGLITNLADARLAIVQIESEGSFVDPWWGSLTNVSGRGSAFIISPDGIAVTNNHVVTGAGRITVWVNGEDQPRYARVLGASECSDLAVIDIDGEGFHYLEWYSGPLDAGLDVYAAGYPLGEPEFALTRGIVSRLIPELKTPWAAVKDVLGTDANLNPGNSGGPLVTTDGQVVGINYAGSAGSGQFYAINGRAALALLDTLRADQDVHAIGINGEMVADAWSGLFGLWVASVKAGSPADGAGLKAGDLITNFGQLWLGEDETLGTYCDVLRSHGPDDVIDIEVLRDGLTGTGQINGRPLAFDGNDSGWIPFPGLELSTPASEPTTAAVQIVRDDSGTIEVSIPADWTGIDGSAWIDDAGQEIGAALSATPDPFSWDYWDTPSVFVGVSAELATQETIESLLDNESTPECQLEGRYDYEDAQFKGAYDSYVDCGGPDGATLIVLAAHPNASPTDYLLLVELTQLPSENTDIFETLMNSLVIEI